jgi:nonsense-mediated mRNA decay protein 3
MAKKRRLFCYVCGRETEELIDGKCNACFSREAELVKLPEKLEARVCRECLRYRRKGRWLASRGDLRHAVELAARDALENMLAGVEALRKDYSLGEVETLSSKKCRMGYVLRVTCLYKGLEHSEVKRGRVEVSLALCDDCSRKRGGYYEAVLQLRREEGLDREVKAELDNVLHEFRGFVSNLREVKKGADVYMASLGAARKAARALMDRLGGEMKESPKLVGRKNGRELYRMSISLRLSKFKRGDVLLYGGKKLQVLEVGCGRVKAFDLRGGRKIVLPLKNLRGAVVLSKK